MTDRLAGIRVKIERAKHHIKDLEGRIKLFRESDPYRLVLDQSTNPEERIVRLKINATVPTEFAVIAGETINQLRSALDHLAWQLVDASGSTPSDHLYFPICQAESSFKSKLKGEIKSVGPAAIGVLGATKPYKGGNDALWKLHKLNNIDKHCLLLVLAYGLKPAIGFHYRNPAFESVLQRPDIQKFLAQVPSPMPSGTRDLFWILQDGDEVFRLSWPDGPKPNVNEKLDFSFEIALRQPQVAEFEPIVPFLNQLADAVDGVINKFVPFL
jgi:hypothetical protein